MSLSDYFESCTGPWGACPVQLTGRLKSGEFVYFRARGRRVELEISTDEESTPNVRYSKELHVLNHELGTGVLPTEICLSFISRWLDDYQNRQGEPSYFVKEEPESINI